MAVTTVAQFAAELNRPAGTLLEQLQSAGVAKKSPDDALTESDKERLLEHLRSRAWHADLSLEQQLDRQAAGLGTELAAALRGELQWRSPL